MKGKTETDPDGAGPKTSRTQETVYDHAGRTVASRYNQDNWTCTAYDARGRVLTTIIPAFGSKPGRTITNVWAVDGNPLRVATSDFYGAVVTETDLLGRTVNYEDVFSTTATSTYDNLGRLIQRTGTLGNEQFVYDNYDRLTDQKLDGVVLAKTYYDAFGRIDHVDYPTAGQQSLASITRDNLGRTTALNWRLGDGTLISDSVTRSVTGQILTNTVTSGANNATWTYGYDKASRLTSATMGANSYSYGFGPQSGACAANTNPSSGKNSNHTSVTKNGQTNTYCYDYADRLVSTTDTRATNPQYDTHGNTTQIGALTLGYDSSDRNNYMHEGTKDVYYDRDVQGRIVARYEENNGVNTGQNFYYGFTNSGDTPDIVRDDTWGIVSKHVQLMGGILLDHPSNRTNCRKQKSSLPQKHPW